MKYIENQEFYRKAYRAQKFYSIISTTFIPNNDLCSRQKSTQLVARIFLVISHSLLDPEKGGSISSEMSMNLYRTTRCRYITLYGNKIYEY